MCTIMATLCRRVSVKLSCCIVLILILTDTAKFKADTITGIGIGASLVVMYVAENSPARPTSHYVSI